MKTAIKSIWVSRDVRFLVNQIGLHLILHFLLNPLNFPMFFEIRMFHKPIDSVFEDISSPADWPFLGTPGGKETCLLIEGGLRFSCSGGVREVLTGCGKCLKFH